MDPEGRGGESTDYLFSSDKVTFRKVTLKSLSENNELLDEVSKNLQDSRGKFDKEKVDAYQKFIYSEWRKVSSLINDQTKSIASDLERGMKILQNVDSRIPEFRDDQDALEKLAKIIESQVEPMSIKVCGRNGLIAKGVEVEGVAKVSAIKKMPQVSLS